MLQGVCNYGTMSARIDVDANKVDRRITVSVRAYGLGNAICEVYPADQYGEAIDRYEALCNEMERRFNAQKQDKERK